MARAIRITVEDLVFDGELNDSATAQRVCDALPIEGRVNRWGDEIYFGIPVTGDEGDEMRTVMAAGELAFWPPGNAFCIFWGPTPASQGDEPRAASDVVLPIAFGPSCMGCGARVSHDDIERGGLVAGRVALCAACTEAPRSCAECGRELQAMFDEFVVRRGEAQDDVVFVCRACEQGRKQR